MFRSPLRSLHLLTATLALGLPAAAQGVAAITVGKNTCDSRIDIETVARGPGSLHHIRESGSYFLSRTITCNPGYSAITIDPAASSVVIDFNGYAIFGMPGMTSIDGVRCAATPQARELLQIEHARIFGFGGRGMSILGVDIVDLNDAVVAGCGGDGVTIEGAEFVDIDGFVVKDVANGLLVTTTEDFTVRRGVIGGCGNGVRVSAGKVDVRDLSISHCTGDGILLDDSALPLGVLKGSWNLKEGTKITDCGDDGVEMRCANGDPTATDCDDLDIARCGDNGFEFVSTSPPTPMATLLSVTDSSFTQCGGSAVFVSTLGAITGRFEKCVATDSGDFAYKLDNGTKASWNVKSSTAGRCASGGFSITSSGDMDCDLSACEASDNGGDGVAISAPGHGKVSISNFTCVKRNAGAGMRIASGSTCQIHCDSGYSADNGAEGALLTGSGTGKVSISSFNFMKNASSGLSVAYGGGTVIVLDGSNFDENGAHGVHVTGGGGGGGGAGGILGVSLTRCRATGNFQDGCNLDCSAATGIGHGKATLQDVHFVANNGRGAYLDRVSPTLSDCSFASNGGNGIEVRAATASGSRCSSSSNGGNGISLFTATGRFSDLSTCDNAGDGVVAIVPVNDPPCALSLTGANLSNNGGYGLRTYDKATPKLFEGCVKGNVQGGVATRSLSSCSGTSCDIASSSFEANGGVAIDLSSSLGGQIDGCTVSSSPVGIRVSDGSGLACSSGVRVTDNTVTACGTGIDASSGVHHLVIRNAALQCTTPYVFSSASLCGPVISTNTDLALSSNPNANYAQ